MTFTITFAWWWIPLAVTIIACGAAMLYDDGDGYLSGIGNLLLLVPALAVSALAWAIAGMLKP